MSISQAISDDHLIEIQNMLGEGGCKLPEDAADYFDDPRGRFTGQARLVVMPKNTQEVSQVVKFCNREKITIIPYSGGTGVVAGQLSIENNQVIILSLQRMDKVRHISKHDAEVTLEAGCILENIHEIAEEAGFIFPLSMASKGSCRIGGNLATNAGGLQVLRYGNARDLCLGIEAVLPDGSIYSDLSPLRKNNTGFDLRHLLIGSEGTLGIITAASLMLKPQNSETITSFCMISTPDQGLEVLSLLRAQLGETISAIELMCDFGLQIVTQHFAGTKHPFAKSGNWYLLIEIAGRKGMREEVEEGLAECMEQGLVLDAVLAESEAQREALWQLRELTPEANKMTGAICSSDTSVALSKISDFISDTMTALSAIDPDLRVNSYGHIGDGNIHHNVFPPEGISKVDFVQKNPQIIESVRMAINEATHKNNGSISAEHGIGRLKVVDLERYADQVKLTTMRSIKHALDPNNILNPGALLK